MKIKQRIRILACSAVVLLASVMQVGAFSFSNGSRVETTANLIVHASHSTSGAYVTTEAEGSRGTIASSSYNDGTYMWWFINWDNGYSGWAVDLYLEPVPTLTITSPNGGENWNAGSTHTVTWTATGDTSAINYLLVAYSTDGWATYNNVSASLPPSTRSFNWTLPSAINSSQVQVRVRAIDASLYILAQDTSDANFTISPSVVAPTVTVTSPNGGEIWQVGSSHSITATSSGSITSVQADYSTDGGSTWRYITAYSSINNAINIPWTIPNTPSTTCKVRITVGYSGGSVSDLSDTIFTINSASVVPTVNTTSPNGSENWLVGSSHSITATSSGNITSVQADYSTDGGSTWRYITAYSSINNAINIPWTIPNTPSTTCKVRITVGYSGGSVSDSSDANFRISPPSGETTVQLSGVPYIHQVYDTADDFTGEYDCCNATAALMAIQYYGKLPANPITCTRGGSHISNYGSYISRSYFYNGHTYNVPSSGAWDTWDVGFYGGFGYFLQDNPGSSLQRSTRLSEYISFHGLTSSVDDAVSGETGFSKICAEVDAGYPVIVLTSLTAAGHYITCIGYVQGQHTLIFNDSYGNKQSGYPNTSGAAARYDWPGYNNGYPNLTTVYRIIYARGNVTTPSIALSYSGTSIPNGDQTPNVAKGTDFGTTNVNFTTAPRTFTIGNTGSGALNLTGVPKIQFGGNNPSDFGMTAQPSTPVAANGGTTTFKLVFQPTATGLRSATVSIANDDPNKNPYTFMVQGTAQIQQRIDPSLEFNATTISSGDQSPTIGKGTDFSDVSVGSQSTTHSFQFYNYGNIDLLLLGAKVQLSGANSGDFSIVSMPSSPIGPNQFSAIGIKFQPTGTGVRTANMLISFDATHAIGITSPYTVALQGTGTAAPTRVISLSGSLAFGSVLTGSSAQNALTIANNGNSTLTVSSIIYPNGFSGNWTSGTIPAGGSQTVTVTFSPNAATSYGGTITVNSDKTGGVNTIATSGTGSTPTRVISLSGSLAFGNVLTGASAQSALTIVNNGNSTLTVNNISYPNGFSGNWASGTIPVGGSQTVTVTFSPSSATSYSGTITVNSDKTSGVNTIAASGTGVSTPPQTFTVTPTAGANGSISPNTQQIVNDGGNVTFTAAPAGGYVVNQWLMNGSLAQTGGNSFTARNIAANMTLQVSFVAAPVAPVAGSYQGLFYEDGGVAMHSSGFLAATLSARGTFTARFQLLGKSSALSGKIASDGSFSGAIARKGLSTLLVQLNFSGDDTVTGQISDGTWTAQLLGNRATYNSRTNPAPQAGKYTLVIPGNDDSSAQPGGNGFGTVKVDTAGNLTFAGTLGDGTKVSQKTFLSKQGEWPIYASLYSGGGSILGWLNFSDRQDDDINGLLNWSKPSQLRAKLYPNGFVVQPEAVGSVYVQPARGTAALGFSIGQLSLENGNLSAFTDLIILGSNNKVTCPTNRLSLTIAPATGLFKGSVPNPATGKAIAVNGVVLQKQNAGYGLYLGTNQTGSISIGPVQ